MLWEAEAVRFVYDRTRAPLTRKNHVGTGHQKQRDRDQHDEAAYSTHRYGLEHVTALFNVWGKWYQAV